MGLGNHGSLHDNDDRHANMVNNLQKCYSHEPKFKR